MRVSTLVVAIVACALAAPFVSAQERVTPVGTATSMDMMQMMMTQMMQHDRMMESAPAR